MVIINLKLLFVGTKRTVESGAFFYKEARKEWKHTFGKKNKKDETSDDETSDDETEETDEIEENENAEEEDNDEDTGITED